jgi:hypothetical protein
MMMRMTQLMINHNLKLQGICKRVLKSIEQSLTIKHHSSSPVRINF